MDVKMKHFKKIILIPVAFFCFLNNIYSTTLGPIDIIGYPSQGPAIDTLRNAFTFFSNPEDSFLRQQFFIKDNFYDKGFVYTMSIFDDKPGMHYKLWMQMKPAPLITIIPGLGSIYNEQTLTALANTFHNDGYSVLAISNSFSWEFMQSAASTPTPGYTIRDSQDTYYATYKIISYLKEKYKDRITDNILVGYSMGAMYTLFISVLDDKYKLVNFARYLAINPPLDLLFGVKLLDSYFNIIDSWPRTKLQDKANKALIMYNKIVEQKLDVNQKLPVDSEEAQYVIGLIFHNTLVDVLSSIAQTNKDKEIFSQKFMWSNRSSLYNELNNYNYYKYIKLFVLPYYSEEFKHKFTLEDLNEWTSLKNIDKELENNPKIRIIHNVNDFLITDEDKVWFNKVFGDRLIYFAHGGHIGNMFFPEVQKFILEAVNLKSNKGFTGPEVERIKQEALDDYWATLSPEEKEKLEAKKTG
jgi:hypothetical protein